MLKLLSKLGLTTTSKLEESMSALETNRVESVKLEQKHYKEALDILEKQYNEELTKLAAENEALQKENLSLLEDVALALQGEKTKGASLTVSVSKAKEMKHGYDPKTPVTKSSSKEMIKKLEAMLETIPDNAQGRGGIDIRVDGKVVIREFSSKNELKEILKEAKAGKVEIVEQAGL